MIDLTTVAKGTRLRLAGGLVGQVEQNLGDGEWVRVKLVEVPPGKGEVGDEELCHVTDIVAVM
jgi:hypothetical protein